MNEVEVEEVLARGLSEDPVVDHRAGASDPALRVLTGLTAAAAVKFAAIGHADHAPQQASETVGGHTPPVTARDPGARISPNLLPAWFTIDKTTETRDVTGGTRGVRGAEHDRLRLPFILASPVRPAR
jgi:hypothetical protein